MKKENTNKERKKLPKNSGQKPSVSPNRLPPIRSIYSVRIDPQRAQMLGFPQKIIKRIIKYYPLIANETLHIEFELKDFEPGIIETFNMPKNHENYRIYKYLYDHRPKEEIIENKLWALSEYIDYFLRRLGFEVPTTEFERNSQKMIAHIEVRELEKVNNALRAYYVDQLKKHKENTNLLFKFPYELKEVKWENLIIQFIDGHTIEIRIPKLNIYHKATYEEMGCLDRKRMMPNNQWELLRELANNYGRLDWGSKWASSKIKKRKSLLSKTLKEYFNNQIPGDPFFSYRKEGCYQTKFQLLPEENQKIKDYEKLFSKEELEEIKRKKEIEEHYKKETERRGKRRSYLEGF